MSATHTRAAARRKDSKVQRRLRTMRAHKVLRLAIQVAFFVLAPGVFASAMNGVHLIFARLGTTQPIEIAQFIVVLVAVLGYTILFGRFFCGYACAFGTMGDVLYLAGTPLRKLLHLEGRPIRGKLASVLRWLKFVVLAAICIMCFTGVWSQVSNHDPWTVFGLATAGTFSGWDAIGVDLLVAIMVLQLLFERSFCRFLCPMGAVFSLMPVLPVSQYDRHVPRCGKRWCNRCIDACPAGIYPDRGTLTSGECFACGRCADVCPLGNVNLIVKMEEAVKQAQAQDDTTADKAGTVPVSATVAVSSATAADGAAPKPAPASAVESEVATIGKPAPHRTPNPKVKWHFKGSGAGWTLVRASVLLLVLWLVGATRFLPDVSGVLPFLPWL